jgi:hypothetical protein|tara:strand:- start:1375 stop:1707 length:333 start_codon:yes stop_codon:yes gene_type:complete
MALTNNLRKLVSKQGVITVLAVILAVLMIRNCTQKSGYSLRPSGIKVSGVKPGSIFDLPVRLDCVPGPLKTSAYYTEGLTPGGVCGGQEFVQDQANYTIDGGIGGSLLTQ